MLIQYIQSKSLKQTFAWICYQLNLNLLGSKNIENFIGKNFLMIYYKYELLHVI